VTADYRNRAECSDDDLMVRVANGDMEAFGILVERHRDSAWRIAYRLCRNRHEAEDVVQDVFLKIYDAAGRYRPMASFRSYLGRVVTNCCADRARKASPIYLPSLPDREAEESVPTDVMEADDRNRAVQSALSTLSRQQRAAVVLRYYGDFGYEEIARALGVTPKAVERLLAKGRKRLSKELDSLL